MPNTSRELQAFEKYFELCVEPDFYAIKDTTGPSSLDVITIEAANGGNVIGNDATDNAIYIKTRDSPFPPTPPGHHPWGVGMPDPTRLGVGIGKSDPMYTLDVHGSCSCSGNLYVGGDIYHKEKGSKGYKGSMGKGKGKGKSSKNGRRYQRRAESRSELETRVDELERTMESKQEEFDEARSEFETRLKQLEIMVDVMKSGSYEYG